MSLGHYETLAWDHWKEFLPKRYKALKKAGTLEAEIEKAAELTDREMQAAEAAGIPRDQAWEEIRGRYLLMNPEPETFDDEGPDHPGLRLIHDVMQATQDLYDEQTEVIIDRGLARRDAGREQVQTPGASSKVNDQTSPPKPTKPTLEKDPFSEEELNKFVLRSRALVPAMIDSVNQTIEDNEKPFNERRKV